METLEALGLETFKERHPGSLSGGQQQRLSLAVALCSRRGLMLYDEPTSGQDGEKTCCERLGRFRSSTGKQCVLLWYPTTLS